MCDDCLGRLVSCELYDLKIKIPVSSSLLGQESFLLYIVLSLKWNRALMKLFFTMTRSLQYRYKEPVGPSNFAKL